MAASLRSALTLMPITPSAAIRPAFFSTFAPARLRSKSAAASMSPLVSLKACLHSIMPSPLRSRSSFTCVAEILMTAPRWTPLLALFLFRDGGFTSRARAPARSALGRRRGGLGGRVGSGLGRGRNRGAAARRHFHFDRVVLQLDEIFVVFRLGDFRLRAAFQHRVRGGLRIEPDR